MSTRPDLVRSGLAAGISGDLSNFLSSKKQGEAYPVSSAAQPVITGSRELKIIKVDIRVKRTVI